MAKKDDKEITVVAELTVYSEAGFSYTIKSFDKAWRRAREVAQDEAASVVTIKLNGFVRKD